MAQNRGEDIMRCDRILPIENEGYEGFDQCKNEAIKLVCVSAAGVRYFVSVCKEHIKQSV